MKSTFTGLTCTTPFPNVLIDEAMPRLKDTSWRVLCVIVRQTLGWHDEESGRRKEYDWLTRSQLKARTGRNSEAIAKAIDTLVRQGYIIAQNSEGVSLKTAVERRKNHSRIYYGLAESWQQRIGMQQHWKSEQLPVIAGSIFHGYHRKTKHIVNEKPNSTKETQTKIKITLSSEVMAFIEVFRKESQKHKIKPDVILSSSAHDRLQHWLQITRKENQSLILQKFFCNNWTSIVRQNYSLNAFANICGILRIDQVG